MEDIDTFFSWTQEKNIKTIQVGRPKTLKECIDILSSADLFVGVSSGLSHVGISVGLPIYLLQYKIKLHGWYDLKLINTCMGMNDFIQGIK
jgi:hypothetical protein